MSVCHDDARQSFLEIMKIICKAEHCHDLRSHCDLKSIFSGNSVGTLPKSVHQVSELSVIHVHGPLPGHPFYIYAKAVSLIDMIIQHGSQQIVGSPYGMKISGKMKVDILHGHHLSIAASCRSALDPEYRAEAGLPESQGTFLSDISEAVRKANGCSGFSFSCRSRRDGSHKYELSPGAVLPACDQPVIDLCLILSVLLHIILIYAEGGRNLTDPLHLRALGYLYIALICHTATSEMICLSYGIINKRFIQKNCLDKTFSPFNGSIIQKPKGVINHER